MNDSTRPPAATPASEPPSRVARWAKRFGVAGFLFFLVKGLLWLSVPTLVVVFGKGC